MDSLKIIPQYKVIYDNIHGYIQLSNIIVMVMDSKQFQRLRKLKQLGSCYYVYQNAVHTRHEHSIGTSYLAGKILESIVKNTPRDHIEKYLSEIPELRSYYKNKYDNKCFILDEHIIELVKIAALCHDLGHGPFSHIFDDLFLPSSNTNSANAHNPMEHHEVRSCVYLEQIIKENDILSQIISDDQIQFLKNLINPRPEHTGFIYQIVSNNLNGLDVDKYDYIARDSYMIGRGESNFKSQRLVEHIRIINNTICYPEQAMSDIIALFNARYNLHKNLYAHKAVLSAHCMITEIFKYLNPVIGLFDSINDPEKFNMMTDEYILTCHNTLLSNKCILTKDELENVLNAKAIIDRLNSHKLYSHVDTYVSKDVLSISVDDFDFPNKNDIIIHISKIGYVSGTKTNPLDSIYSYKTKDRNNTLEMKKVTLSKYSLLIADNYQEWITMVFYKQKNKTIIEELKNKFRKIIKDKNL